MRKTITAMATTLISYDATFQLEISFLVNVAPGIVAKKLRDGILRPFPSEAVCRTTKMVCFKNVFFCFRTKCWHDRIVLYFVSVQNAGMTALTKMLA
jgi:hypothetical protein